MNLEDPLAFFRLLNETTTRRLIEHKNLNGYQKNLLFQAIAEAKESEPDMNIINSAFMMLEHQKGEGKKAKAEAREYADALIAQHQKNDRAPSLGSNRMFRYLVFVLVLLVVIGSLR